MKRGISIAAGASPLSGGSVAPFQPLGNSDGSFEGMNVWFLEEDGSVGGRIASCSQTDGQTLLDAGKTSGWLGSGKKRPALFE